MFTQTSQYGQVPLLEGCLAASSFHLGRGRERKRDGKVSKWSLIFFLNSPHLRCSGLIFRRKKKANSGDSGRQASFSIVKGWAVGLLYCTLAWLRRGDEDWAGMGSAFILHLAWFALIKHPVSFLCFSYQKDVSWIFYFCFFILKALGQWDHWGRRVGGHYKTGRSVSQSWLSPQPDGAAVCLPRPWCRTATLRHLGI